MALTMDNITVHYGTTTAVNAVTLTVGDGEILGLLGPSGCGKSTLLRTIAGLETATTGHITWDGQDMGNTPVHQRGFGLMFQDGQLFPHKNVGANVAYGLTMRNIPRTEKRHRVTQLLELVGLAGAERRDIHTMSGGERQRVALARALAPRPAVLLLDEPLSALDRELRERLAVDVRAILRATNTTAVFVTHDHDEAFTVADRVAIMRAGEVLQTDTPEKLWRSPATRSVAEFLGYEAIISESPFIGYAPGHHTITATHTSPATPGDSAPHSSPANQTPLTGILTDRMFRTGHPMGRVTIPTLGTLTCNIAQGLDPQLGDTVTLTPTPPTH
ncbi:ABC transporter ATP-binding protein [Jonesia quinghaiensis]|uniref:ABC transporter ATP-binding protein n=1 Tax=Jonesia quinghaiensis TaxID=262806 RepID=UPI000413A4FF|nr:ABC transporter ATP-binding protein [Jonesia quinghaiensis]